MSSRHTLTPSDHLPDLKETETARSRWRWLGFPWWVWMLFLFIAVGGGLLAIARAQRLLAWSWDLGFYIQDLYAIRSGSWINSLYGFGVFSDHVSPVLVPLAYAIGTSAVAEKLVAIQALVVGLTVFPLYRLGKRLGGEPMGFMTVFWFACSAAMWHALMFDFHPVTLVLPVAAWLLLENEKGSQGRQWLPLAITVLIREDVAFIYGLVVLLVGLGQRRRSTVISGASAILVSVGYFVLMSRQVGIGNQLFFRFGGGDLTALAARPFRADVLIGTAAVLLPLLVVLPLRGWKRSWPGLFLLCFFAISGPKPVSLYYQYYAQAVPFLIAGAAGAAGDLAWTSRKRLSILATVSLFVLLGPLVYLGFGLPDRFASEILSRQDRELAASVLTKVPAQASVSATEMLTPALAYRADVHPFPGPMICANSILYYTPSTRAVEFVALEKGAGPSGADWEAVLSEWGYRMIAENELIEIWQLAASNVPMANCPSYEQQKAAVS